MEVIKEKFDNLPESEKAKFLLEIVGKYNNNELSLRNSSNHNVSLTGQKSGCVERSPEGTPRKKQKTLDSWLIKGSSPKKKIEESPRKSTEPVNGDSLIVCENNSQSTSEAVSCNGKVSTSNLNVVLDQNNVSDKSESVISNVETEKHVTNNTCDAEASKVVHEKYNLRPKGKAKRNDCNCCSSNNGSSNSSKKDSINDNSCELLQQNCHNQDLRTCKTSQDNGDLTPSKIIKSPKSKKTDLNHSTPKQAQCAESNLCEDNNNVGASPVKEARYNTRTKTKKLIESNVTKVSKNVACDGNQLTIHSQGDKDERKDPLLSDYEAYCKLNEEFSEIGLNIVDVVNNEKIQNLLCDQKNLSNEAVIFIGTFKSGTGEVLPVAHQIQSKAKLLESLCKLKKKSSN